MCDKTEFEVCRLCLNSRGLLMSVFGENSKLQFMLEKTIEDLIDVKVVEDANYPWLVCSNCMEKLTEFRLFKRRCAECLSVFYHRIQKGCSTATKDWIPNREEFSSEIKKSIDEDRIASDTVDSSAVDIRDDKIVVKVEVDTTSPCTVAPEKNVDDPMVASMQGVDCHWSSDDEAGNLDPLEDGELRLSFNEEVNIKDECYIDISQEEGCLQADLSQKQLGGKGQDGMGNILQKCQICNERFAQKDILEAHVMLLHPVKSEKLRGGVDAEAFECTSDFEAGAMAHRCAICSGTFSQKDKLKSHMLTHTGGKPDKCPETFNLKQHREDHVRMHAVEKSLKCEVCSEAFTMKQELTEHRLRHSGARPHECELCSKAFSQKAHLKRHMLTHTGERPYKCEICLKGFHHKQNLECHMLSHTGEKPYKCEVCPKTFTLKHHLKDHARIHVGEKPFKCELCSKAFRHKQHLKEHVSNHRSSPQQCAICSRAFTHSSSLKRHLKVHIYGINRIPI
ncbi:zinc finger protein 431-like [Hetaerina americana]|uniref:zinc finger protein 431-like n=1 Tax=Hetaerina americana TaxID=62018 RepID=UPI003A7F3B2A